jgi:hypothetical protein
VVTIDAGLRTGSYTDVNLVDGDILRVSTLGGASESNYSDNLFDRLLELSGQVKILKQVGSKYAAGISYYGTDTAIKNLPSPYSFAWDTDVDF